MLDWLWHYGKLVSPYLLALLTVQKILAEVFGITMLGKKIYKGAPGIWKRLIARAVFRKEMSTKVDTIIAMLEFNGGNNIKDIVKRVEAKLETHTLLFKELKTATEYNALRLDLRDQSDDRMLFKLDAGGACIFINDAFLKWFSYTEKDILDHGWESIICGKDLPEVLATIDRAIKNKTGFYTEHKICDRQGQEYECIVRGYAIKNTDGELFQFFGTIDLKEN